MFETQYIKKVQFHIYFNLTCKTIDIALLYLLFTINFLIMHI